MKIICINGLPRAGKDLFCDLAIKNRGLVYKYSTIDWVKEIAKAAGWNEEKDEKGRKFLSDLKDAMTVYNDGPRKHVIEELRNKLIIFNALPNSEEYRKHIVFFIHVREPEEIRKWEEENGAKSLLIMRNEADKINSNHADREVYEHLYDYVIGNHSTVEEFEQEAINFIDRIREEEWESNL